jgi:hypothetical protein
VLRPGGRLAVADIIPLAPAGGAEWLKQRASSGVVTSRFAIPEANAYPRSRYREILERCGFTDIRVASIRNKVYAPLHRHLRQHPEALQRQHPLVRLSAPVARRLDPAGLYIASWITCWRAPPNRRRQPRMTGSRCPAPRLAGRSETGRGSVDRQPLCAPVTPGQVDQDGQRIPEDDACILGHGNLVKASP